MGQSKLKVGDKIYYRQYANSKRAAIITYPITYVGRKYLRFSWGVTNESKIEIIEIGMTLYTSEQDLLYYEKLCDNIKDITNHFNPHVYAKRKVMMAQTEAILKLLENE